MKRLATSYMATFVLCVFVQAAGADERTVVPAEVQADVKALVEEVLDKAVGNEDQKKWARSVIGRALGRAGGVSENSAPGSTVPARPTQFPLAAERHASSVAKGLSGREASAEVLIFMSLSVPPESWRQWAAQAERAGAPLVLRGVLAGEERGQTGSLRKTAREVGARLGGHDVGVAIDPRLFRFFGVERVPAVAVVPGGVPACASRGCSADPPPPHDLVGGNIGLVAALEAVADKGGPGREAARLMLERLRGKG
ncbi:type-F conjugative transfer system pilin assembly protein TrbC [Candidatus Poribacteria bacterium]|nr:type-F conjugative transfer system pilin assembly protein TrbC [Candidatus Poribacteria bacterium]